MQIIFLAINIIIGVYLLVSSKPIKKIESTLWIAAQIILVYSITRNSDIGSIIIVEMIYIAECIYLKYKWSKKHISYE